MRCAVVDTHGLVVNVIMADSDQDPVPENCVLHEILDGIWIDIGMNWGDRIVLPTESDLAEGDRS
jgi:hypothetical protein